MVPVRLVLKNFMSYGEDAPPLDLAGMHTVCLSGENGNGKSALLDAITWALWGESRAGKNRHDDLVRIGADEMSVEFTFEMDGLIYRVLRKRSKRASGNQWELQQEAGDAGWRSLTGNNAGETEKAIQKLLRMNYDTFLNSAYLRQGQADQFVKQPPGKRKEILADILDLSRYDRLEAMAREKARDAQIEATDLERDINLIDVELAGEPEYRERMTALEAQHERDKQVQDDLRRDLDLLRAQQGKMESDLALVERLRQHEKELDRELVDLEVDLKTLAVEHDRWAKLLEQKETIRRRYEELQAARSEEVVLRERVAAFRRRKDELGRLEREWLAAENDVRRKLDEAQRDLKQTREHVRELPALKTEIEELRGLAAALPDREAERDSLENRLKELRERFTEMESRNAAAGALIAQWQERLRDLEQQKGVCSVCNAPLPPDRIASTREFYQRELDGVTAERRDIRNTGRALKEEIAAVEKRRTGMASELETLAAKRARLDMLEGSLRALQDVERKLPEHEATVDRFQSLLASGEFAPKLRDDLARLRQEVACDATAENLLAEVSRRVVELAPSERAHMQLGHAEEAYGAVQERYEQAGKRRAQKLTARRENAQQLQQMEGVLTSLAEIAGQVQGLQRRLSRIEDEDRQVQQELGRYRQLIAGCEERRKIRVEKAEKLSAARRNAEAHEQLSRAFGKKGVQALIIENAIPELEDEANRLLARLTDGDMQVYFQTLREAKSKRDTPIETLEIQVADNLGTRPLEMYSGGEGFRASFAIRIALSKLLTRRAGARLQTLIIDEGFGTQDGKGREKLVDALNTLKSDFERVIVITHIDELKDAFATRIEVVKTPLGSQISVIEGSNG